MRRPQIAVVGSASGDEALLSLAHELGVAIVDRGWRIVCGGLSGVMHAVASGAHQSAAATGGDVIGVLPSLDSKTANPFIDIVLPTGMQYARNTLVVGAGDVIVAVGGGAGTLSEIALAWQLKKPIVALACSDGWAAELAGRRLDSRRGDSIHAAKNLQEALTFIAEALDQPREGHVGF